jgi:hypothetical protein
MQFRDWRKCRINFLVFDFCKMRVSVDPNLGGRSLRAGPIDVLEHNYGGDITQNAVLVNK